MVHKYIQIKIKINRDKIQIWQINQIKQKIQNKN